MLPYNKNILSGDYRVYARFEANSQFVETNWEFKVA